MAITYNQNYNNSLMVEKKPGESSRNSMYNK